jgi:hypothetical protein
MRLLHLFFGVSLFVLLLSFATFKVNDPDTIQYLADGRLILSHGLFTNFCIFNYIQSGCQQAYMHEWLSYLLVYVAYLTGQWNAIVLFQITAILQRLFHSF